MDNNAGDRRPHQLDYINHRGERATRLVDPERVWLGNTEWHAGDQWLLECYDHDREAKRNYALAEIQHWDGPDSAIPRGIYRHFKGGLYLVVGTLRHSEDEDLMVRYRQLSGQFEEWVRPLSMFNESVLVDGQKLPRFEYLGD